MAFIYGLSLDFGLIFALGFCLFLVVVAIIVKLKKGEEK